MKLNRIRKTCFVISIFSICLISCVQSSDEINSHNNFQNQSNTIDTAESKSNYDLANDFLMKLKTIKVDTIIFWKRTCIGCCDYYNIFWIKDGTRKLNKFYFDFSDMKTRSDEIEISDSKIFTTLFANYNELTKNPIKENIHKNGNSITSFKDHYCYTQLKIYIGQDSLLTKRVKDHYFDEFTDFNKVPDAQSRTNDNYQENIDSKWNKLLTTIENQIATMSETSEKELETLRTRKNKTTPQ